MRLTDACSAWISCDATSYTVEGIIGLKELTLFAVCYPAMLIGNNCPFGQTLLPSRQ
ncbi:hypothetical protein [Kordiimonas lacus]|uniref:hypothetical protein n=1 Tax=Kordiimonas lacus TaxID=637679 RepID=UPI001365ECB0|nr:hypothetical protein [Kordiimonas lacus]